MRRRTQTEQFKTCFPKVNVKTAQGMLIFQGFLAGLNKAIENHKYDKEIFERKELIYKTEIEELKSHIHGMKLLSFSTHDLEGDEHP